MMDAPGPIPPDSESAQRTPRSTPELRSLSARRLMLFLGLAVVVLLAYLLRGVLVPLFLAFLLAYALDPFVDRLDAADVPRSRGGIIVMFAMFGLIVVVLVFAVPMFIDELRAAAADLPSELEALEA